RTPCLPLGERLSARRMESRGVAFRCHAPPVHEPRSARSRPPRERSGRRAGARLRRGDGRPRARRRLDPDPRSGGAGADVPAPRHPGRGGRGPVRLVPRSLALRRAAPRRHRARPRPDRHAARRGELAPRGDRLPEDRLGDRPDDPGARKRRRAPTRGAGPRARRDEGTLGGVVAWTEELLRNHRALSEVDIRFRDEAMRTPALMNRAYFESFGFEGEEVHYWIGRLHGWPTFVGPEFRDEMARVTEGLSRLLRLVPERIFDNDPERIAAFYRIEPYVVRLVLTPEDLALAIARADMILTEDGLRCLEYNFGSNLGGSESHSRLLFYRRVPEI